MAVEAGLAALRAGSDAGLDLVCLASTTPPYAEKSSAAILAAVLDCGPAVGVADLGGSLRAGTTGLRLALDAVRAGSAREALVAAADLRLTPPGSDLEPVWGDGAAAVRLGQGDAVIARLVGAASHTHEFSDVWRLAGSRFPEQGDPTFVRAYGYERLMAEPVGRLLSEAGVAPGTIRRAAVYAPDARLVGPILGASAWARACCRARRSCPRSAIPGSRRRSSRSRDVWRKPSRVTGSWPWDTGRGPTPSCSRRRSRCGAWTGLAVWRPRSRPGGRFDTTVRRKVKRSAQTVSQHGPGSWPRACGTRRCRGGGASCRPRQQHVGEYAGAIRDW